MADIKWTFFADTQAAERAIVSLEGKYTSLENKMSRAARTSRQKSDVAVQAIKSEASAVVGLAAGYLSVANAITMAFTEGEKLRKQQDDAALKYDEIFRKFRLLAGLNELQAEGAKKSILAASQAMGFSAEQGGSAAQELVSSGFSAEQAQGPALLSLLKVMAAEGSTGANVEAGPLAKAMATYLTSQGKQLTSENIESVGIAINRLGKESTIKMEALQEIAKQGAVFKGKLSQEEQLATTTRLIDIGMPASESVTAMRNMVLAMTSQGLDKKKVEALSGFGLTPGDIDLQGETFLEAMGKFRAGMDKLQPEMVDPLLKKFFEKENVAGAKALIGSVDRISAMTNIQDNAAAFAEDVALGTSGRGARGRRLKLAEEVLADKTAASISDEDALRAFRISEREQGRAPLRTAFSELGYQFGRSVGGTPEESLAGIIRNDEQRNRIIELLEQNAKAANEQVDLLKKAGDQKVLNRKAQSEQ